MRHFLKLVVASLVFLTLGNIGLFAADAKAGSLTVVGLYSETSDGFVVWRLVGKADWAPVKVGDLLPANAEIRINVDRDWVEFIQTGNPMAVYEVTGPDLGELVRKVADIVKDKPRTVAFPKGSAAKPDPAFKDKLVVTQYLGRQIYMTKDGDSRDIKYGAVLDISGKVKIIAINNTITLMNAVGGVAQVIGPLNFTVEQVLNNKNLYKFLNVQK